MYIYGRVVNIIEKIIAFGKGERLQLLADFINKYSGFDVVEIWDNDVNKCGNIYEINGKELCVNLPYFQDEYNIIVTTDIYI